jgi:F-box/WD-40 domain protein 10
MENREPKLKQAPYFRCEKGPNWVPVCQKCEACVLAWKIFATKEWFRRVNDISQRRFLVSILGQLNSLYLLQYFQNILETTQGKDFIYNRSRIKLSRKGGKEEEVVKSSLNQMLDKTVERKMKEILYWFGNSTHRTKANYTLLLLQMCDSNLLLTAANVIRVLFMKEWNSISGESRGPQRPDTGLEGGIGADRQAWKGRGCPEGWYGTVNLILTSYHLPKEELLSGTSF